MTIACIFCHQDIQENNLVRMTNDQKDASIVLFSCSECYYQFYVELHPKKYDEYSCSINKLSSHIKFVNGYLNRMFKMKATPYCESHPAISCSGNHSLGSQRGTCCHLGTLSDLVGQISNTLSEFVLSLSEWSSPLKCSNGDTSPSSSDDKFDKPHVTVAGSSFFHEEGGDEVVYLPPSCIGKPFVLGKNANDSYGEILTMYKEHPDWFSNRGWVRVASDVHQVQVAVSAYKDFQQSMLSYKEGLSSVGRCQLSRSKVLFESGRLSYVDYSVFLILISMPGIIGLSRQSTMHEFKQRTKELILSLCPSAFDQNVRSTTVYFKDLNSGSKFQ